MEIEEYQEYPDHSTEEPRKSGPKILAVILLMVILLGACLRAIEPFINEGALMSQDGPAEAGDITSTSSLEVITLPISVYILDDENGELSSERTIDELDIVYEGVNEIWGQAGIYIEVESIQRLTLPSEVIEGIVQGDFEAFFHTAGREYPVPALSLLNGFYASEIGGPNGINPASTRTFFVVDAPLVHDERVTAHEIGHILGLHHTHKDPNRLLFSGANGVALTDEEIAVARYVAQGLLAGMR